MRLGIVAGEASGDHLGAGLIRALRRATPELEAFGVAGPGMRAEGCEAWADMQELAVMGLAEVARHLPRLVTLRRRLFRRMLEAQPDVFVGVDAPDFNLGLERRLRGAGLRTVQYVSPSVWAWRRGRMRKIRQATDCVLCLLPFETAFYEAEQHPAVFTGHPLADEIPPDTPQEPARQALSVPSGVDLLAVLPGSRMSEVARIGPVFALAIARLAAARPALDFIAPTVSDETRALFAQQLARHAPGVPVTLVEGRAREVIAAADAVLLASGTATLETLLVGRPHVVAYRISPVTAALVRGLRLMHTPYYSLTNLLAGRALVPEFLQEAATPERLAEAVAQQLDDREGRSQMLAAFRQIQAQLRRDASARAADAVMALAAERHG